MRQTVVFEVKLPLSVKREGKWFVSSCPPLDVHSQGPSEKKAVANLVDALQLFLLSCYDRGTLDRVLRDSGFRPRPGRHVGPRKSAAETEPMLSVPLPFVIEKRREETCRA